MTLALILLASGALSWAISIASCDSVIQYCQDIERGEILSRRVKELNLIRGVDVG